MYLTVQQVMLFAQTLIVLVTVQGAVRHIIVWPANAKVAQTIVVVATSPTPIGALVYIIVVVLMSVVMRDFVELVLLLDTKADIFLPTVVMVVPVKEGWFVGGRAVITRVVLASVLMVILEVVL